MHTPEGRPALVTTTDHAAAGPRTYPPGLDVQPRLHRAAVRRRQRAQRRLTTTASLLVYLVLSVLANWNAWSRGLSRVLPPSQDPKLYMWYLTWTPFSLVHGFNPFFTDWVNYPFGVNLADNTPAIPLGLVSSPLNFLFGPVAQYNILSTVCFFTAAASAYVLIGRWVAWRPAAFVGGLLFGFSPYMVGQGYGHVNLQFTAFVPLFALLLDEILVRQTRSPVRLGVLLGLLTVLQYLVSSEILATVAVTAVTGLVVLILLNPRAVAGRWLPALTSLVTGGGLAAVLMAYPVWYSFRGAEHVTPQNATGVYRADLLGAILPTSNEILSPAHYQAIADGLVGNLAENATYLGIPLIAIMVATAIVCRRSKLAVFALIMAVLTLLFSMGSPMLVDHHHTVVVLPGIVFRSLPLLKLVLPVRFSLYVALFAAILLALCVDRVRGWSGWSDWSSGWGLRSAAAGVVAAVALVPLIPSLPYQVADVDTPAFFTSAAVDVIPQSSVAIVYPMTTPQNADALLWQASAHMRFKVPSYYGYIPTPGTGVAEYYGQTFTFNVLNEIASLGNVVALTPVLRATLLAQWRQWHVGSIVVASQGPNSATATRLITGVLSRQPIMTHGVALWLHVGGGP